MRYRFFDDILQPVSVRGKSRSMSPGTRISNLTARIDDCCLASIDIGSHTIRLLAARIEGRQRIVPLALERRITRLARNFQYDHTLKDPAIQDSISVLKEYSEILASHGIQSVACGATGVVRRAENSARFLKIIKEVTGLSVTILSESSEAYLSAKGTFSVLHSPCGLILSFDLGGSSTEFLLVNVERNKPLWDTSVFMGAATITQDHLTGDPPDTASILKARIAVRQRLEPAISAMKPLLMEQGIPPTPFQLVGTAGTASTLAAMFLQMEEYKPYRVNGLVLSRKWLDETVERLSRLPVASRRKLPGLEKGREDIILGGALIVQEIMDNLDEKRFTVADGGLLEGLFLNLAEKQLGWPDRILTPLTWEIQTG